MRRAFISFVVATVLGTSHVLAAQQDWPQPAFAGQTHAPQPSERLPYRVETIATGFTRPFAMAFLPNGRFLVTERRGLMRTVGPDGQISAPIQGLPAMLDPRLADPFFATGAFYDVLLSRTFRDDRLLYLNYRSAAQGGPLVVARARLSPDERQLENTTILFQSKALEDAPRGLDGRLLFAPDGTLLVTVSSPADPSLLPQQLNNVYGKILRINLDGSVPRDNPFRGRQDALPEIYSYGHRDPQGAALEPHTQQLWTVEHGPKGGDEINLPLPGRNYGWPVISYGLNYDDAPIGAGITARAGMEQPLYYWNPSIAPSGMTFYSGELFPTWQGDLFVGALTGRFLVRLIIKNGRVAGEEHLLEELHQRIRDVRQGPDGALYVLTDPRDAPDRRDGAQLLKIIPAR